MRQVSRRRFGNHRVSLSKGENDAAWYYCLYIEGKQYRKSMKTVVLDDAWDKATALTVDILAKQKSGQKIFSITLGELRREFLLHLDKKVAQGSLKRGSCNNIIRQIDHGFRFLMYIKTTPNAAVDSLSGKMWQQYVDWSLQSNGGKRRAVVHQELTSIRSMFKFAKEHGWCSEMNIPVWELVIEKEPSKRRRVSLKEGSQALIAIAGWAAKKDKHYWRKQMLLTVAHIINASGMRTGEVLNLKNSDIELSKDEAILHVRAEVSKVKTSRQVAILHSAILPLTRWLNEFQKDKSPEGYVFGETEGQSGDYPFYTVLKRLRHAKVVADDFDIYHFRHIAITKWILSGQPLFLIAKLCGTSSRMIESTYANVITAMLGREFAKRKLNVLEDGSFEIEER